MTIADEGISGLLIANSSPTVWGMTTSLTASVASGTNVTYSWQLGDGESAAGEVAEHIYPASGSYTATVNDPGLVNLDFDIRWDFDDGTIVTGTITLTHTYLDDGIYDLAITLTDTLGAANTYIVPLDVENVAPDVTIAEGGGSAEIDQILTFSGDFTDPGADSYTILWDFGDGITTTGGLTVEHAFESAGTFDVILTVTDDDGGVGTDKVQVVVQSVVIYMPVVLGGGSTNGGTVSGAMHWTHFGWHEALAPNGRKIWSVL